LVNNKKLRFVILAMIVALIGGLVVGCGTTSDTAGDNDGSKAVAAKPDKVYTLKIATTWPESITLHQMPQKFGEIINAASGGRMKVEVYPSGALMGAAEVLDAASSGTIDGYHDYTGYWIGKMPAAPFFANVPMFMDSPDMYLSWIYEGGGLELWQKLYDESGYNVKVFPLGITHPEILAQSNKPMKTFEDWQGLKYRTVGWWGDILREFGVAVTSLPGAEVYPSLERGVIDAAEFSTPYNNKVLGFDEVTKYLSGPGMHQPATLLSMGINKDSWNELPPDLQELVTSTARSVTLWGWMDDLNKSMKALKEMEDEGMETVYADTEVQEELYDITVKYLDDKAKEEGGIFAEIWDSMKTYREEFVDYEEFMMPIRVHK